MTVFRKIQNLMVVALMSTTATAALSQTLPDYGASNVPKKDAEYSPYLNRGYPEKVLWGDTHLHTG